MSNLSKLKNSAKKKRCFILGNGPSLKEMNLENLYDEEVFVVNWFVLSEHFAKMKNCHYLVCDPHFWNYGEGIHPELISGVVKNESAKFFFDASAKSFIEGSELYNQKIPNSEQTNYLSFSKDNKIWEGVPFEANIEKTLSWGYTVIIDFCLPLAFYMGFEEVYLLGCDCDYKLDKSKDFDESFFYDISKIPEQDIRHLEVQRDERQSQMKHVQWFESYRVVKEHFEANNKKIFNCGVGGKLEVFERKDYESLF